MANERENRVILTGTSIESLKRETRVGAIDPKRLGNILYSLLLLTGGDVISSLIPGGGSEELPEDEQNVLSELLNKISVDTDNMLLKYKQSEQATYVTPVELLAKPSAPSYSGSVAITTTSSSQTINLTNNTEGAQVYYCLTNDGTEPADPRTATNPSIGTSIQLTDILDAKTTTFKIKATAKRNGEFSSSVLAITIVTTRKIATPVINESATTFDTSRNISITLAGSSGANIYYTTDGTVPSAENGTLYSAPFPLTSSADTPVSTNVKAVAVLEDWESSDTASKSVTVGAKKTYIGFSTKATLSSASDIQDLQLSLKRTSPEKNHLYTVTQNTNGATGYIWICCTGTINNGAVYASADAVIDMGFNAAQVVNGWNCYRIGAAVNETSTTLIIKQ